MAAVAMLGVAARARRRGRRRAVARVTILLVADPWLATSLGFALSAVGDGLAAALRAAARRGPRRVGCRARSRSRSSVPLAAQLACGPLLVLIAPTVPVYGVLANLLAAPAAPVATLVGLAACLAAPLPVVCSPGSPRSHGCRRRGSPRPRDRHRAARRHLPWLEGWPGAALLAVVGVAVGVVIARRDRDGIAARAARPRRRDHRRRAHRRVVGRRRLSRSDRSRAGGRCPPTGACSRATSGRATRVLLRSAGAVALVDTGPAAGAARGVPRPRGHRPHRSARADPLRSRPCRGSRPR